MKRWILAAALAVCGSGSALADVKLPTIFGDNMVLQTMAAKTPVWGTADAGENVTVKFKGQQAAAVAGADGKWAVRLDLASVGDEPGEFSVTGKNAITFKNVVAGEVWVASGQSNMEWVVRNSRDSAQEIAAADFPQIREFALKKAAVGAPAADCAGSWRVCTPETVGGFSAVGFFFARELNHQIKRPIGVIHTSWGGTPAEAWTSKEALLGADDDVKVIWNRYLDRQAKLPEIQKQYEAQVAKWKEGGSPANQRPRQPEGATGPNQPANLYNGMIAPIIGYGMKGAIWYQGESNAGRAYQYRKLFPLMIQDWRTRWGQGDFPFYYVQLANFMAKETEPKDSAWAELREAQTLTLKHANTGMAVIIDIGDATDIHPKNKQDVGKRLAQWALKRDYARDVVESGPLYASMAAEGASIRVKFNSIGGGLECHGGKLVGFAIAGEDKKFVWADARIDGDSVVVSSPSVAKPVAVRYGWANNPDCNLFNNAGLPASPFRTDEWVGVTAGKN